MKSFQVTVPFLALLGICAVCAHAGDFVIDLKVNGESAAEIRLSIENTFATATVANEIEKFNLKEMSWFDENTKQWVTLAQAKDWAEQSKAKTMKSVDSAPPHIRPFVLWSLNPKFKTDKSNDKLRLTSGQVDYVIEGEASKNDTDGYFRYAILNAYKKAMAERKLPPYSELKAIEEMKTLGGIPQRVLIAIPGIPKSPSFEMLIREAK